MGRLGLLLLLLVAALCAGARGLEGSGEPGGSRAPGPPPSERCLLPKVVGRCRASFPRWWYNATSQACQAFVYGGCGANLNNFLAEDACRLACVAPADGEGLAETPLPSQKGAPDADLVPPQRGQPASNSPSYEESCMAPRVTGPCRASFPRWFYDPAAGACQQFVYGGCKGNRNNYLREEQCLQQCHGAAGGLEGPDSQSTKVVLLAVLLAVLLGLGVVVCARLCRKSPELPLGVPWRPLDDKEHLMSNTYRL